MFPWGFKFRERTRLRERTVPAFSPPEGITGRQGLSLLQDECGLPQLTLTGLPAWVSSIWPSRVSPAWLIGLRYGNIYGFGLSSSLLIRIIYCWEVSTDSVTRIPNQSLNTNKQGICPRARGKLSPPCTDAQSHRRSEVSTLGFNLCLVIQENGRTKESWSHSADHQCQTDLEERAIRNDHPLVFKKKNPKKFIFLCLGQLQPAPALVSSLLSDI